MQRLILLILIGFAANWFWRNRQRQREAAARMREGAQSGGAGAASAGAASASRAAAPEGARASRRAAVARPALAEPMVRCAYCNTHLPVSEATSSAGLHFCHPRHARDYAVRVAQAGDGR